MIELNIRLDVRDQAVPTLEIIRREEQAVTLLGKCGHHRDDVLVNGVWVRRLVVAIEAVDSGTLHQLADELQQDCIAVYNPDHARGELLGPSAAAWGEFDLARFQRFSQRKAADEEMAIAFGFA